MRCHHRVDGESFGKVGSLLYHVGRCHQVSSHAKSQSREPALNHTTLRVAQALNLNHLGPDPYSQPGHNGAQRMTSKAIINREVKKRTWWQLVIQGDSCPRSAFEANSVDSFIHNSQTGFMPLSTGATVSLGPPVRWTSSLTPSICSDRTKSV
jgi:hypothetical protein